MVGELPKGLIVGVLMVDGWRSQGAALQLFPIPHSALRTPHLIWLDQLGLPWIPMAWMPLPLPLPWPGGALRFGLWWVVASPFAIGTWTGDQLMVGELMVDGQGSFRAVLQLTIQRF